MIDACRHQQLKNMWSLAVYSGVHHGELVALAWEDIDLKAGTMTIRRNHTLTKKFTLPKTDAVTNRVNNLIQPAIDMLKNQAELTRLGRQYQIEVKLREYGRSETHPCTFVFNPQIVTRNGRAGHHYAVGSVNQIWEGAMRHDGIRYRKAYQSLHTYTCWSLTAGANPDFIARQNGSLRCPEGLWRIRIQDGRKQPGPGEHAGPEISRLCSISALINSGLMSKANKYIRLRNLNLHTHHILIRLHQFITYLDAHLHRH